MKEEEAKTKWCPQIRFTGTDNEGFFNNRGANCNCLASDCMMWKWDITLNRELAADKINRDDYEGYCGLAK